MAFTPSVQHGSEWKKLTKLLGSPPAMPTCTAESTLKARPGYSAIDASEYLDSSECGSLRKSPLSLELRPPSKPMNKTFYLVIILSLRAEQGP